MSVYKIKADKALFDEWQVMSQRVRSMSAIVQNDMEITITELIEWEWAVTVFEDEFAQLVRRTAKHVKGRTV
jgi:hypothetical protein